MTAALADVVLEFRAAYRFGHFQYRLLIDMWYSGFAAGFCHTVFEGELISKCIIRSSDELSTA